MEPLVELANASFGYTPAAPVAEGVSFALPAGEALALIGENGAGKSTLLAALLGQVHLTADRIRVPTGPGAIAVLPQHQHQDLSVPVTVREVVGMGRLPHRRWLWPSARDRELVAAALREVGMDDLAGRPFAELSGGQRQRVLLARAITQEPQLLLLDEPLNGLDVTARERLAETIQALKARGIAVVLSTHDPQIADAVAEQTLDLSAERPVARPTAQVLHPAAAE